MIDEVPTAATAIVAEDHPIVRRALRLMLERISGLSVVEEVANGIEAVSAAKRLQPSLLLLDHAMPYAQGLDVIIEVRRWSPHTKIAVLTGLTGHGLLTTLMEAGVEGLLLKSDEEDELLEAVKRILEGERHLSHGVRRLIGSTPAVSLLTSRELQILTRIVNGGTNAAIAKHLGISPKTVDNHRTNIMRKLNFHSAAELTSFAVREGILESAKHVLPSLSEPRARHAAASSARRRSRAGPRQP